MQSGDDQHVLSNREHQQQQQQQQQQQAQEGIPVQQRNISLLPQLTPKNLQNLSFFISVIAVFAIFATVLLRNGENNLNPIAFIIHMLSFLLTPSFIIFQNYNLKSFAITTITNIFRNYLVICSFLNTNNQIEPIVI